MSLIFYVGMSLIFMGLSGMILDLLFVEYEDEQEEYSSCDQGVGRES